MYSYRMTSIYMELEAIVTYRNKKACFKIRKEGPGIYLADLIYFDGDKKDLPECITLMKGVRHWTGSISNEVLLRELGRLIDQSSHISNSRDCFSAYPNRHSE